jgi:hypothetical protein
MCTPRATPLEIAPAPEAVAGESCRIKPGKAGPILDDQRDRIGVDRTGTNPVAVSYRISPRPPRDAGRRQAPDPPEQRALCDRSNGEPRLECSDRAELGWAASR